MVRNYAFVDHGMYLSNETLQTLARTVCGISEEEWKEDKYAAIEEVHEKLDNVIYAVGQFSGAVIPMAIDGELLWGGEVEFDDDTVYFVPLSRQPNLITAAYQDIEEIVCELKGKIGQYLPVNFDYRSNICEVAGTYWCD